MSADQRPSSKGGGPPREPYADLPDDVCDWLDETYTPEGVGIWLNAYANADEAKRERLVRIARMDGNCS